MPVVIRESGESEAASIAKLRWTSHSEGHPRAAGRIEDYIDGFLSWWERREDFVALVAVDEERIIGMGFLALARRVPVPEALDRRHGDVQSVYVLPEYRNQGIGSRLVEALVDYGRAAGCLRITVQSGTRAVPVYERAGFQHSHKLMVHPLID